jgi:alpha-maltose-1-phosphate synthase
MIPSDTLQQRVLVAHPGTQYAPRVCEALHAHSALHCFCTGIAFSDEGAVLKLAEFAPQKLRSILQRRQIRIPSKRICSLPWIEIEHTLALKLNWRDDLVANQYARNLSFQKRIPAKVIHDASLVMGFDGSSVVLVERSRKAGKPFCLNQSIGHPLSMARVFSKIKEQYPEWEMDVRPKQAEFIEFEATEHRLADVIVVPSKFVASTLIENGVEAAKLAIVPFGTDTEFFKPTIDRPSNPQSVFLFVGSLNARKGMPVLLNAWRRLNPSHCQLLIAGYGEIPDHEIRKGIPDSVRILGRKNRNELKELLDRADVFLFPSYFEGLAQVQIEAQAMGVPVVGTRASGAEDLVENGINGIIIPEGSEEDLMEAIERFLLRPHLALEMRENTLNRRKTLSWNDHGHELVKVFEKLPVVDKQSNSESSLQAHSAQ